MAPPTSILFAAFMSLFSFDVFGEGTLGEQILAFLIHLTPVYIIVILLVIAWKWEWVGGAAYLILAILYAAMTRLQQHWSAYLVISGTLVVLIILFFLNWKYKEQLQDS